MSDRWQAVRAIVIAGKTVEAGATFTAPNEAVAVAVRRGLVAPAPKEGKRK